MRRNNWNEYFDGPQETHEIYNVAVYRETERAILVVLESGQDVWIPKSQISEDSPVKGGIDVGTLIVSQWFAENNL